jgi:2'-5' RNA ligase
VSDSWRTFCAIELPSAVRARLEDHVRQVRGEVPEVAASWTRIENVHLTLKFFGNVAVKRIEKISAAVSSVTRQFSTFEIEIGGAGVFPKASRAQVLWIGVNDPSGKLAELQQQLEEEFSALGFEKEGRAFKPHLTLARLRRPDGARQLAEAHLKTEFQPQLIKVHELILYRSELSHHGSKYTALSRHNL